MNECRKTGVVVVVFRNVAAAAAVTNSRSMRRIVDALARHDVLAFDDRRRRQAPSVCGLQRGSLIKSPLFLADGRSYVAASLRVCRSVVA